MVLALDEPYDLVFRRAVLDFLPSDGFHLLGIL